MLRNGEFISSGDIKDTTPHAITSDMVGTKYVDAEVYEPRQLGEPILTLHGLSGEGFDNIDLTVRRGRLTYLRLVSGSGRPTTIRLHGRRLTLTLSPGEEIINPAELMM